MSMGLPQTLSRATGPGGTAIRDFAYTYKTWDELEQAELVPFCRPDSGQHALHYGGPHLSASGYRRRHPIPPRPPRCSQITCGRLWGIMESSSPTPLTLEPYRTIIPGPGRCQALQAGADLLLMPADFKEAYNGVLDAAKKEN